jgi:pyroglutamyl-peptidase
LPTDTVTRLAAVSVSKGVVSVSPLIRATAVNPERVAINIDDGRIADNDGAQPIDVPVREDGPPAYFSSLPVKAMVTAMRRAGFPAAVSNTAGTFVCNHIMYSILYMIDREFPGKRGGFIHVPYIPQQVVDKPNAPAMSVDDMAAALTAGMAAIVEYRDKPDEHTVGGTIH